VTADYALPPGVLSRQVEQEMVLLNMTSEQYYSLDAVGAQIVTRVTTQSLERAIADLTSDYDDVTPEVLRADVTQLIAELCEAGLLERVHR
jgi:hypothetical protein